VTPPDDSNIHVPTHSVPPAADDLGFDLPEPTTVSRGRLVTFGIVSLGVLAAAFLFGYLPKHRAQAALVADANTEAAVAPFVVVVTPKVMNSDHAIVLSGSVRPLEETVIYPQANGYISSWLVDIGDKVKEGQVLAEIATPALNWPRPWRASRKRQPTWSFPRPTWSASSSWCQLASPASKIWTRPKRNPSWTPRALALQRPQ
jgi:hypothetical protein